MRKRSPVGIALSYLWKTPLCALAYVAGMAIGGPIVASLKLELPKLPPGTDAKGLGTSAVVAALLFAPCLGPLAGGIQGGFFSRWLVLAALTYISLGLNVAIESAMFSTLGGTEGMIALFILPSVFLAAALALLFAPEAKGDSFRVSASRYRASRSTPDRTWRLLAAIAAFPAVYFLFGMCVGPFVAKHYTLGEYGLRLPPLGDIIRVQFARSTLFALATLPVLIMWSGRKRQLVPALGLALYVLVGLSGLVQAYWLPLTLRAPHALEILADSLVHAWVLVALLGRREQSHEPAPG
jgi:hypothetical protein